MAIVHNDYISCCTGQSFQLRIPHHKLKELEKELEPLSAVIEYWLKGNVTELPRSISWKSIVTVLRAESIGESGLADQISKKYCEQRRFAFNVLLHTCFLVGYGNHPQLW